MTNVEAALEAIEERFRNPSKRYAAARYIVRQKRKIPKDEQEKICEEIPIAPKTLEGLFTELRKMGLYPPQEASETTIQPEVPEVHHETSEFPENPEPLSQEYATKEDIEILQNSINYLAAVISGVSPDNLGEYEVEEEEGERVLPERVEMVPAEEIIIRDPSLIRRTVYLKSKTMLLFDLAKQGAYPNYVGTNIPGPFTKDKKYESKKFNLSDFINNMVDDYTVQLYDIDIGFQPYNEEIEVSR